jgi:3-oxoadipate enol-lactonase
MVKSVTVNGLALHFADDGPRDRPALVFANSLGTDFRIWDGVMACLGGAFRIIRYDKRGHGLSDVGRTPYTIDDHVADLAGLLDARQVGDAVICGVSVGGQIALGLAARRPDLVRSLILSDTAHRIGPPEIWDARIAAIELGGLQSIADAILQRWFSQAYRQKQPTAMAAWRNMLVRMPAAGYAATCAALRESDLTEAARGLKVPTLCLCGDQDASTPPDLVKSLAALIPGARFQTVANAGHLPGIEQPQRVADLILEFAQEHRFA